MEKDSTVQDMRKTITQIRHKIQQLSDQEHQIQNLPIEIPPEFSNMDMTRIQTPKEYHQIIAKQRQMQLRRMKAKSSVTNSAISSEFPENPTPKVPAFFEQYMLEIAEENLLMRDIHDSDFQRPWGKLDLQIKTNRLMDFWRREILRSGVPEEEANRLRIILNNALNDRSLSKQSQVEYDSEKGLLRGIKDLQLRDGIYYMKGLPEELVPPPKRNGKLITQVTQLPEEVLNDLFK